MGKFRTKKKGGEGIPTSALPDIIFILLFFFMVVTKMKKQEKMVDTHIPEATQVVKKNEALQTIELYIGVPKDKGAFGDQPVIQANDRFITPNGIRQFMAEERGKLPIDKQSPSNIQVAIIADDEVDMGKINDIEKILKDIGFRKIFYKAAKNHQASL